MRSFLDVYLNTIRQWNFLTKRCGSNISNVKSFHFNIALFAWNVPETFLCINICKNIFPYQCTLFEIHYQFISFLFDMHFMTLYEIYFIKIFSSKFWFIFSNFNFDEEKNVAIHNSLPQKTYNKIINFLYDLTTYIWSFCVYV